MGMTYAPHPITCPTCGHQWELTADAVQSMHECGAASLLVSHALCDTCEEQSIALELRTRREDAAKTFLNGIPSEYRNARPERVPACYADAKTGQPLRLGLIGPSGSGKSCAMAIHIMQRKQPFLWLTSNELREITTKAATEGNHWTAKLERMRSVAVLVIDDLSQARFTEAFSSALYELLEIRNKNRLAVLWTSQKNLPALRAKITEQCQDADQAEAISRRLGQDAVKLEAAR